MSKLTDAQYAAIFAKAHAAGMDAGNRAVPAPMTVSEANVITGQPTHNGRSWYVSEGVCGFAWIAFPGNTAFGRWAKRTGKARSHYPKGLSISVREFGQSMQRKEAYASAFARVLAKHGIEDAYPDSRMD